MYRNTEIRQEIRQDHFYFEYHRSHGVVSYSEQRARGPDIMPDVWVVCLKPPLCPLVQADPPSQPLGLRATLDLS